LSRQVDTLSLAVNVMGIARLHDLALATAVIGTFDRLQLPGFDMAAHWRRSIHVGILARLLATHCRLAEGERLFVAGLLHDIGHLVMYLRVPEDAAAAMRHSREQLLPLAAAEREALGFHYGEVGATLMAKWLFPQSLQEICQLHPNPARAQHHPRECSIVAISQHAVWSNDPEPDSLPHVPPLPSLALELAGLDEATVARVTADSAEHLANTLAVLLPRRAA
jgi:HD-like signal output (HDOD) protein